MGGLPSRFWEYVSASTLKREAASFLMFWLLGLATVAFYLAPSFTERKALIELFLYPIMFGFFGAFGLDWISKQTTIAGPPQNVDGKNPAAKPSEVEVEGTVSGTLKVDNKPEING